MENDMAVTRPVIGLLGCGGTISMKRDPSRSTLVPAKSIKEVYSWVEKDVEAIAHVEPIDIMKVDSTNMRPRDWTKIAKEVKGLLGKCHGFVITHGTDTMAYTAGALALAFGSTLPVPIVLTGSQLTIDV